MDGVEKSGDETTNSGILDSQPDIPVLTGRSKPSMADIKWIILVFATSFAAFILLFLLYMTSEGFSENMQYLNQALKSTTSSTVKQTTSTIEAITSTIEATTSTTTSYTLPTTTQTTSSTSSMSSTSSTTMSGLRCSTSEDCGGGTEFRCKGRFIYNFSTTYTCRNPGTPYSQCVGKVKNEVVYECEIYEDCVDGECIGVFANECEYRCYVGDYTSYYCANACDGSDTLMDVEGRCSSSGINCCCKS
ncbi:MAG: hypothetical protein KKD39_07920 [Candidatus Altiarchaeota archaeon]|nr:hypothetical protein [Candidatus Altiarchaeota archaeon]